MCSTCLLLFLSFLLVLCKAVFRHFSATHTVFLGKWQHSLFMTEKRGKRHWGQRAICFTNASWGIMQYANIRTRQKERGTPQALVLCPLFFCTIHLHPVLFPKMIRQLSQLSVLSQTRFPVCCTSLFEGYFFLSLFSAQRYALVWNFQLIASKDKSRLNISGLGKKVLFRGKLLWSLECCHFEGF